ncbi:MAG TPA: lipopolysaccharide biosynthesis protein, partial [Bacteroidales bacterium]|nr:lipopolysaccharide biosynthesis protein [Bacteroidales bacterium]
MARLPRSGFIKNFTTLLTGTAIAQVIPVLLQPLLRRLFDAEVFALFAVYNSITSILIVVVTLRYEMAIVLPEKSRDASALVTLSLGISVVFSFLFALVIAILPDAVVKITGWPAAGRIWLWAIPPGVLFFSAGQTFNYWLIRHKAFRASAGNRIARRTTEGAMQSAGGLAGWQGSLLWGDLAGRMVNMGLSWWQSARKGYSLSGMDAGTIRKAAHRYRDFPLFQALPAILNTASLMIPVVMVNRFYSANATAQFDLSRQVLALPLALITTAMSQVLLQKFSEQRNMHQKILPGFLKLSLYTTLFAVGVALFFVFTGEPLFAFLFGQNWSTAGVWAAILAPAFMIQFVVSPLRTLIIA